MNAFLRKPVARGAVAAIALAGAVAGRAAADPTPPTEALVEALVEARAEADRLRARLEALEFGRRGAWTPETGDGLLAAATLEALRIVHVRRDLGMVVINGGRRDGMRPGMTFGLMRGDRLVGRVRVIDVRREICGALIERQEAGRGVAVNDRPVLLRETM